MILNHYNVTENVAIARAQCSAFVKRVEDGTVGTDSLSPERAVAKDPFS